MNSTVDAYNSPFIHYVAYKFAIFLTFESTNSTLSALCKHHYKTLSDVHIL